MKRTFLILMLVAGCAPRPGSHKPNPDVNPLPAVTIETAATQSAKDYLVRIANASADIAQRIDKGELKTHPDTFAAFNTATKAAREAAMKPYEQAVADRLKPNENKFDAPTASKAFREVESGFRKAAK